MKRNTGGLKVGTEVILIEKGHHGWLVRAPSEEVYDERETNLEPLRELREQDYGLKIGDEVIGVREWNNQRFRLQGVVLSFPSKHTVAVKPRRSDTRELAGRPIVFLMMNVMKKQETGGKAMARQKKGLRVGESKITTRRVNGHKRRVRVTKLSGTRYRVRVLNPIGSVKGRRTTRRGGYPDKYGPGFNQARDRATRSSKELWER